MKRGLISALIVILLSALSAGAWWWIEKNHNTTAEQPKSSQQSTPGTAVAEERVESIQYQGQSNHTALELLKKTADIATSGSGDMVFVTTINDIKANPNTEFWEFRVNGEIAQVGAAQYETEPTDTITWTLTPIDTSFNGTAEEQ